MDARNLKMVTTLSQVLLPTLEKLACHEAKTESVEKKGPTIFKAFLKNPDPTASTNFLQLLLELIREWAHVYGKTSTGKSSYATTYEKIQSKGVVFPKSNRFVTTKSHKPGPAPKSASVPVTTPSAPSKNPCNPLGYIFII